MKLVAIIFAQLAWAVFLILYAAAATQPHLNIPTFTPPDSPTQEVAGCNVLIACLNVVGDGAVLLAQMAIYMVVIVVRAILFALALIKLIIQVSIFGFQDAPWWVNLLIITPFLLSTAVIAYKLIRKGDSED